MQFRIICNFHVSSMSSTTIKFSYTNQSTGHLSFLAWEKGGVRGWEEGCCSILMIPTHVQSVSYSFPFILCKTTTDPQFVLLKTIWSPLKKYFGPLKSSFHSPLSSHVINVGCFLMQINGVLFRLGEIWKNLWNTFHQPWWPKSKTDRRVWGRRLSFSLYSLEDWLAV